MSPASVTSDSIPSCSSTTIEKNKCCLASVVDHVLTLSVHGKGIKDHYLREKKLDKFHREKLISAVVEMCFVEKIFPTTKDLFKIADDICSNFPSEDKVHLLDKRIKQFCHFSIYYYITSCIYPAPLENAAM